jgi:hypothetical protein
MGGSVPSTNGIEEYPIFVNEPTGLVAGSTEAIGLADGAKIGVRNFHPGARAEYLLRIANGKNVDTTVGLGYLPTFRYKGHELDYFDRSVIDVGYVVAPSYVSDWIVEGLGAYEIGSKEVIEVLVAIEMPEDAEVFAEHWEFRLWALDLTPEGNTRTGAASRWLIDMR